MNSDRPNNDLMRRTGRTTRMILAAIERVRNIDVSSIERVYIITNNSHHVNEIRRKLCSIVAGDLLSNYHNSEHIYGRIHIMTPEEFMGTDVFTYRELVDAVIENLYTNNNQAGTIFIDSLVLFNGIDYPKLCNAMKDFPDYNVECNRPVFNMLIETLSLVPEFTMYLNSGYYYIDEEAIMRTILTPLHKPEFRNPLPSGVFGELPHPTKENTDGSVTKSMVSKLTDKEKVDFVNALSIGFRSVLDMSFENMVRVSTDMINVHGCVAHVVVTEKKYQSYMSKKIGGVVREIMTRQGVETLDAKKQAIQAVAQVGHRYIVTTPRNECVTVDCETGIKFKVVTTVNQYTANQYIPIKDIVKMSEVLFDASKM